MHSPDNHHTRVLQRYAEASLGLALCQHTARQQRRPLLAARARCLHHLQTLLLELAPNTLCFRLPSTRRAAKQTDNPSNTSEHTSEHTSAHTYTYEYEYEYEYVCLKISLNGKHKLTADVVCAALAKLDDTALAQQRAAFLANNAHNTGALHEIVLSQTLALVRGLQQKEKCEVVFLHKNNPPPTLATPHLGELAYAPRAVVELVAQLYSVNAQLRDIRNSQTPLAKTFKTMQSTEAPRVRALMCPSAHQHDLNNENTTTNNTKTTVVAQETIAIPARVQETMRLTATTNTTTTRTTKTPNAVRVELKTPRPPPPHARKSTGVISKRRVESALRMCINEHWQQEASPQNWHAVLAALQKSAVHALYEQTPAPQQANHELQIKTKLVRL